MTNTLHRRGTREELEGDYIVKPAFGRTERTGVAQKLKTFMEIAVKHHPIATRMVSGGIRYDNLQEYMAHIQDDDGVLACFDNVAAVKGMLADLKAADLGLSIVVSGLVDEVDRCCREVGLALHSVEHSLGILGRRDLLPPANIVDIGSLCGHGMVSYNLIRKMVDLVKLRRLTPQAAAAYLSRPCVCGAFNPKRAQEILERLRVSG